MNTSVLESTGRTQRTEFVPNSLSSASLPRAASEAATAESLAAWENEGGTTISSPNQDWRQSTTTPKWVPSYPAIESVSADALPRNADQGNADRHTLGIMQVSLLLAIPALATLAIFWGFIAQGGPSSDAE